MLKNYFKTAARNVQRHKGYALINLIGLAVGLACCLLILLFVQDERSYDRFHEKAARIYRVTWNVGDLGKTAAVPASMLPRFKEDFPQVEAATHLFRQRTVVQHKEALVKEDRFYYADEAVFDVFTFPLIAGNPKTALTEPNTVVLTASTARRYFGDQDALGQTLTLNDGADLRVTGVAQDVPANAHFTFDALVSLITLTEAEGLPPYQKSLGFQGWQYLLLTAPDAAAAVEAKLDEITSGDAEAVGAYFGWWFEDSSFDLQPLTRIHLYSNLTGEAEPNSDVRYLYVFSLIAVFILLLACINYTNLATARSANRGKEVGVRKVVGAQRGQLARQFLSEALALSVGALALAVALLEALLPFFNELVGKTVALTYTPATLGLFLAVALVTGLLAGGYPALFLARLEPIRMLRGGSGVRGGGLRKGLVTFQFAVSIALIISTLVVQRQLSYLQHKRLGYDTEQILQVSLRGDVASQAETFKAELNRLSGVVKASLSSGLPGRGGFLTMHDHEDEEHQVRYLFADPDYLATMGMTLVEGRNFDPARPADTTGFLINEVGAQRFGLTDKIGQAVDPFWQAATTPLGIVSDFHTASLHEPLMPTVILMDANHYKTVVLRLQAGRVAETLAALETTWQRFVPNEPFDYLFLDAILADQYRAEQRLGRIFIAFSLLAVLIACLGLFGLAAFTAEQRTKEIGIRKVLGATATNLVALLSKDFVVLVVAGTLIAAPVAYLAMERWLDAFAYRVELSGWLFLGAGLLALLIAVVTVSYQAIKTALANPVKALRYE